MKKCKKLLDMAEWTFHIVQNHIQSLSMWFYVQFKFYEQMWHYNILGPLYHKCICGKRPKTPYISHDAFQKLILYASQRKNK